MPEKDVNEQIAEIKSEIKQLRKDLVELELKISGIVVFIKQIKAGNR